MTAPALADLQRKLAAMLLAEECNADVLAEVRLVPATISAQNSLRIHRNTARGALVNALQLSYPTVLKLVGDECFEQLALRYASEEPPTVAQLAAYGGDFSEFVARDTATCDLKYLSDVARFDRAFELKARARVGLPLVVALDDAVTLALNSSVEVFQCEHAVDEIHSAVQASLSDLGCACDLSVYPRAYALWQSNNGVSCVSLSPASMRFVIGLLRGETSEVAIEAAVAESDNSVERVLATIAAEVFQSGFAQVRARAS